MGTVIAGSAMAPLCPGGSIVDLAAVAGDACISSAGINRDDIELLIHTGIYREDNIVEPALAPLLQRALGINADPFTTGGRATFSFDLLNGSCGIVNAFQMIASFFAAGVYSSALVISGDTHPSRKEHQEFPYSTVVTALLLQKVDSHNRGFRKFFFRTSDEGSDRLVGAIDFPRFREQSRRNVAIRQDPEYLPELTAFTGSAMGEFLRGEGVTGDEIDHLVISQPDAGFAREVAVIAGVPTERILPVYEQWGDLHSSALAVGYIESLSAGTPDEEATLLFAAAGAGYTVACALYQQ